MTRLRSPTLTFLLLLIPSASGATPLETLRVRAEIAEESANVWMKPVVDLTFENVSDTESVTVPLPNVFSITCWAPPCVDGDIYRVSDDGGAVAEPIAFFDAANHCYPLERTSVVGETFELLPGESRRVRLTSRAKRFPSIRGWFMSPGRYRIILTFKAWTWDPTRTCPMFTPTVDADAWTGEVQITSDDFWVHDNAICRLDEEGRWWQ